MNSTQEGKVVFVGAGPGDPGLITIKGLECINNADVIVHDAQVNLKILEDVRSNVEIITVSYKGRTQIPNQADLLLFMIEKARAGKTVARVKVDDPFGFGYSGDEAEVLTASEVQFEVVPGVPLASAITSYAGIPLSGRDGKPSITFIQTYERRGDDGPPSDFSIVPDGTQTLIFLSRIEQLPHIVENLQIKGLSSGTPAAVICEGTTSRQRVTTGSLGNIQKLIKKQKLTFTDDPVLIAVGEAVRLQEKLNWFERKPLFGKKILITRASEQAGAFSSLLKHFGAEPVEFPTIEIVAPNNWDQLDKALKSLTTFDWVIFTSVNGVKYFLERLFEREGDIRDLKGLKICAIGSQTAATVQGMGVKVDLIPEEFRAESIIEALGKGNVKGLKILIPRAEVAREILPEELRKLGAEVVVATAYRTIRPEKRIREVLDLLEQGKISMVTFTSSSTVNNFVEIIGKDHLLNLLKRVKIGTIGPITAKTVAGYGLVSDVMPEEYTILAMTRAIVDYYRKQQRVN